MVRLLPLIALLFLNACSCQREITRTGVDSIKYGTGGGFTGAVVSYSLSANGQLNKTESNQTDEVKIVEARRVLALFGQAAQLKDYTFNEPGNMYSFVEIQAQGQSQYISWSIGSDKIDSRATELFGQLMDLTK
jgi:hypothetical protein